MWHVCGRGAYRVLVGKWSLGRHRCRWEDNIKIDLQQVEWRLTELIWLRTGTGGGLLYMRLWYFGFHKYGENFLTSWEPVSFSRTLVPGVSKLVSFVPLSWQAQRPLLRPSEFLPFIQISEQNTPQIRGFKSRVEHASTLPWYDVT